MAAFPEQLTEGVRALTESMQVMQQRMAAGKSKTEVMEESIKEIYSTLSELQKGSREEGGPNNFRTKEANDLRPKEWTGEKGSRSFTVFTQDIHNWAGALHDDMKQAIRNAEIADDIEKTVTAAQVKPSNEDVGGIPGGEKGSKMSRYLWQCLIKITEGSGQENKARAIMWNRQENGFIAWKKLVNEFDPREAANDSTAVIRIMSPESFWGQAKDEEDFKRISAAWEQEVNAYQIRTKEVISDSFLKAAYMKMLPPSLGGTGGRFRGEETKSLDDLKAKVWKWINDKPVTIKSDRRPLNAVEDDDQHPEPEDKKFVTMEDLAAFFQ